MRILLVVNYTGKGVLTPKVGWRMFNFLILRTCGVAQVSINCVVGK